MLGSSLTDFNHLTPGNWYPYWNPGKWSFHQLIYKLVEMTGPAYAAISSYTVSEEAIRTLFNLSDSGHLSFDLFVDNSAFRHKKSLIFFASNCKNSRIFTLSIHAKVMVIHAPEWKITVISSANLSPNARCETGVICTITEIADQYLKIFSDLSQTAMPLKFTDYGPL